MTNEMMIFENPEFGRIRTVMDKKGEPLFCLADVCKVLGITNSRNVKNRLDEGDVHLVDTPTSSGTQRIAYTSEPGLYLTIMRSDSPVAKPFRKWVTSEVLPQVRKTGGYIPVNAEDDEKTIMAKALEIMNRTLAQKDELIEAQKPKVAFANAVTTGDGCILISEMAKLLTRNGYVTGRTRFFRWLRENGYIFKKSTEPIQKWVEMGIFATSVTMIHTHHGAEERVTTKVTGKGQEYFLRMLSVECGMLNGRQSR